MTITEAITDIMLIPLVGFLTSWFIVCVCGWTFVEGYEKWPPQPPAKF